MPASAVSSPTASTLHPDRRVGRHRAGDDAVAGRLGDRLGLAGDHRLVELGRAVDDRRRRPGPGRRRGPARRRRPRSSASGDGADVVAVDDLGVVGQQLGQRGQGAAGLADRLHLLPVAEQHDRHQRGELPPELEVEPVEARRHRRDVGDGDRHRDQQHHPGLAVADLGHAAGEERPAAPPEHERAEHRPEPRHAREVELGSRTSPSPSRW